MESRSGTSGGVSRPFVAAESVGAHGNTNFARSGGGHGTRPLHKRIELGASDVVEAWNTSGEAVGREHETRFTQHTPVEPKSGTQVSQQQTNLPALSDTV